MQLCLLSLTADYTVSTVPTDKGLIVLGIRESCYPVQAAAEFTGVLISP